MTVIVNGEPREIPENSDLASLLEILELAASRVAIELNQVVIRRADWQNTILRERDRIEIVHFVGGGSR
jgi:thiamine biosynthesis protein ThiS